MSWQVAQAAPMVMSFQKAARAMASTNSSGIRWRNETGITGLYTNGRMAHSPFKKLCRQNETNLARA
jgi:hypothetical protein